jgi:ribosome-binding protein aMBF1 (putative translation factor)
MVTGDLMREARRRAGLTQAELGRRIGKPQSVIGRWERGEVLPSFETLRDLIRACGFELTFRLAARDDSYRPDIERMLELKPAERVARSAKAAGRNRAIRRTAAAARGA